MKPLLYLLSTSWFFIALAPLNASSIRAIVHPHEASRRTLLNPPPASASLFTVPFTAEALDVVDFYDTTPETNRGNCGPGPIDAKYCVTDAAAGIMCSSECYIGWTEAGEWVEYEFQSARDAQVGITARLSSYSPRSVRLLLDGTPIGHQDLELPGEGWERFLDRSVSGVQVTGGGVPHRLRVVFLEGGVNLCSVDVSLLEVPFVAQALEYTSYMDTTEDNRGDCGTGPVDAKYVGVDNPTCSSECYVGYTAPGEFVEYTFLSENDALVDIAALVASFSSTRKFRIKLDGKYVSDYLTAPGEGWEVFRERRAKDGVYVRGGMVHRLRVEFINGGINLCSVQVMLDSTIVPSRDKQVTRIEAENYRGYNELTPEVNFGDACDRGDGVDMQLTSDSSGGNCNVGWTQPGEWLEYGLLVKQGQPYSVGARLASNGHDRFVHLEVDGDDVSGPVEAPQSGWQDFEDRTLVTDLYLAPGPHALRFVFDTGRVNLNCIDVDGEPRRPFDVAAYLPLKINTCFVGDRCDPGPESCVGLLDDNWNIVEGFTTDTFGSVKPSDASDDGVCLELTLLDWELEDILQNLEDFADAVYRDSNREIELKIRPVVLENVDASLTRSWGDDWGFNVPPEAVRESAEAELDFVPDFGLIIPPTRDPNLHIRHGVDYGGLAFLWSTETIGGGLCAWIPQNFALSGYFGHEWLHLLDHAYHEFSYIPDLYPERSDFPPCGQGYWDSYQWMPNPDWCTSDPDFVSCGDDICTEHEAWGPHILADHFNPGVAFVANHCKNGRQDYLETDVDAGGHCLNLS